MHEPVVVELALSRDSVRSIWCIRFSAYGESPPIKHAVPQRPGRSRLWHQHPNIRGMREWKDLRWVIHFFGKGDKQCDVNMWSHSPAYRKWVRAHSVLKWRRSEEVSRGYHMCRPPESPLQIRRKHLRRPASLPLPLHAAKDVWIFLGRRAWYDEPLA